MGSLEDPVNDDGDMTNDVPDGAATAATDDAVEAVSVSQSWIATKTQQWQDRINIVRQHFERKGYRVHSGLQFGCELVLYADDPSKVHSDFCVHVVPEDGSIDWRSMQTLVRSMPDLHKTLILAYPRRRQQASNGNDGHSDESAIPQSSSDNNNSDNNNNNDTMALSLWQVDELALATEHAPFRHKSRALPVEPGQAHAVGAQVKRQKSSRQERQSNRDT